MSSPGYTDEVAEECHDLIDRAEEEAHVSALSALIRPAGNRLTLPITASR